AHREETAPRPQHVSAIEAAHTGVRTQPEWSAGELVDAPAYDMTQRMTAKEIRDQEDAVDGKYDRADADAERGASRRRISEPERLPHVGVQNGQHTERQKQRVPVEVLKDERERVFTEVARSWLSHRTRRWISPEGLVVRAAIVITGQPEQTRDRENQECRR